MAKVNAGFLAVMSLVGSSLLAFITSWVATNYPGYTFFWIFLGLFTCTLFIMYWVLIIRWIISGVW